MVAAPIDLAMSHATVLPGEGPLVRVRGLTVQYRIQHLGRASETVQALAGIDMDIRQGEVFGLVGESGSGKTTLARALLKLVNPTAGSIFFDGYDIARLGGQALRRWRGQVQVVFQDPVGSLDPRASVRDIVGEPIRLHLGLSSSAADQQVASLIDDVGLGRHHLRRRAHELSGGQCQRVAIARALALRPKLLVLDEPTSSLDVSVQAQILNLLGELRGSYGLTYLLISHDLSVVRYLADRIGVMYVGRLIEQGPARDVFASQRHPYTRALISAAPDVDGAVGRRVLVHGDPPSATDPPPGCPFHPRCWLYRQLGEPEVCTTAEPKPVGLESAHHAACHFETQVPNTQPGGPAQ